MKMYEKWVHLRDKVMKCSDTMLRCLGSINLNLRSKHIQPPFLSCFESRLGRLTAKCFSGGKKKSLVGILLQWRSVIKTQLSLDHVGDQESVFGRVTHAMADWMSEVSVLT